MSNPFINTLSSGSSSDIKVNNISPNYFGKTSVPLTSLPDVVIDADTFSDGEVRTYDTASSAWKNKTNSNVNLSSLSDCSITNQSVSSTLLYNSFVNKWINVPCDVIFMDFSSLYVRQID